MAEIQAALEKVRLPITAGHRARLAAAQTDRCPQARFPGKHRNTPPLPELGSNFIFGVCSDIGL